MKFILLILISALLEGTCSSNAIQSIKLESRTRGYQEIIEVKQDLRLIHIIESPQKSVNDTIHLNALVWQEFEELIGQISLVEIPNLIAPSNESQTDRVLIQTLEVQLQNENSFLSSSFDKGNPPKEIADIVSKIEAMIKR